MEKTAFTRKKRLLNDAILGARVKTVFTTHSGCYGAKRIAAELKDQIDYDPVNHKRVARVMRELKLFGYTKKRKVTTTVSDKTKTVLSYVVLSFVYTYVYGAKVLAANSIAWFGEEWGIGKALSSFGPVLQNIIWYDYGLVTLGGYFFQARSIFALVPIFMADRLPGKVRLKRYTAYWFYPVHIALLVLTAYILWGGNI